MTRFNRAALAAVALGAVLSGSIAATPTPGAAHGNEDHGTPAAMDHGHAAATPGATHGSGEHAMGGTGAAYMIIRNTGKEDDRLVAVKTEVARVAEIHEVRHKGGVMEMRPLEHGLEIDDGEAVTLEPGGYHIMLIGLTRDLKAGDRFELILRFEHAGEVAVPAEVRARPAVNATAEPVTVGDIEISDVWSRPAPALAGMAGATPAATPSS
ncbi:MAG: copper chaperone PCu(A)C [Thermomicrobiales bacterium]|nr:copper chaperone PCu(A)C [Thermomicrobiales bacterium]